MISPLTVGLLLPVVFAISAFATARLAAGAGGPLSMLDEPNHRSLHVRSTPRSGGLAILAAFFVGVVMLAAIVALRSDLTRLGSAPAWILGMLLLIAIVSICDDRWSLPAALRLLFHLAAASAVVFGAALVVETVDVPFVGTVHLGFWAAPLCVLAIAWMTNLYNFMDGMDGIASFMSIAGFALLAVLALRNSVPAVAALAALVVPAVAGFFVHNRPPASIFMGDSGSTSLGFLAGTLSLAAADRGGVDIVALLLLFSPFLVDATVTLVRRALGRKRIWQAHREHYYQRLVLAGWSQGRTLIWEGALMLTAAAAAAAYELTEREAVRAAILLAMIVVYGVLAAGVRHVERTRRGTDSPATLA